MVRSGISFTLFFGFLLAVSAAQILKNSGFEGNPKLWNFNEVFQNGGSIDFDNNQPRARFGSKLAVLRVRAGAVFPARVRLGQENLNLEKGFRYVYSVLVRVDSGLDNSGLNGRGAIVSAFCERGNNLLDTPFTGKDVTISEAPRRSDGSYRKELYRRISFTIIGDGKPNWRCWVGLFGQPFDISRPAILSVDAFKLTREGSVTGSSQSGTNVLAGFTTALKVPGYFPDSRINFINGSGWYREQYLQGVMPAVTSGRLQLAIRSGAQSASLSGVVRQVQLKQGQVYHMCINYERVTPTNPPSNPPFTTFNYFVRLPQAINDNAVPRKTQGLLLGRVDVQVGATRIGRSTVKFVAPASSNKFEVVLRLNRYANENINGQHVMNFNNPRIVPVENIDDDGC